MSAESLADLLDGLPADLAEQALTHSSWVEQRAQSYGRLAFLGDRVLGLTISNELFSRFPEADAGKLTPIHAQTVSARSCAEVAHQLGLPGMLELNAPSDGTGRSIVALLGSDRQMAEIAEAVIGACFLEYGFERTAEAIVDAFSEQISFSTETRLDFKSELQEWLARSGATVTYEVIHEEGPAHERRFEVTAVAKGEQIGSGSGRSKKEAEQAAAQEALEKIKD